MSQMIAFKRLWWNILASLGLHTRRCEFAEEEAAYLRWCAERGLEPFSTYALNLWAGESLRPLNVLIPADMARELDQWEEEFYGDAGDLLDAERGRAAMKLLREEETS